MSALDALRLLMAAPVASSPKDDNLVGQVRTITMLQKFAPTGYFTMSRTYGALNRPPKPTSDKEGLGRGPRGASGFIMDSLLSIERHITLQFHDPFAGGEPVSTGPTGASIKCGSTDELVLASTAEDRVASGATPQGIVPTEAADPIVSSGTIEDVDPRGTDHDVHACSPAQSAVINHCVVRTTPNDAITLHEDGCPFAGTYRCWLVIRIRKWHWWWSCRRRCGWRCG